MASAAWDRSPNATAKKDATSRIYLRALAENTRALIRDRWRDPGVRVALEPAGGSWKCTVEAPAAIISEIIRSFGPTPGRTLTKLSPAALCFSWTDVE